MVTRGTSLRAPRSTGRPLAWRPGGPRSATRFARRRRPAPRPRLLERRRERSPRLGQRQPALSVGTSPTSGRLLGAVPLHLVLQQHRRPLQARPAVSARLRRRKPRHHRRSRWREATRTGD
ncbi:unnamed protein product, partial [Ectocarpus sp. 12 AP-2014]